MLVQDEQVSVVVQSAQDEPFIELADHTEFPKVALAKHLTQLIVTDRDVLSVYTIVVIRRDRFCSECWGL